MTFQHSHKKRKHGPYLAEFWYWLQILGVAGAVLHQPLQVQVDFDAIMFYMLHNDNIISTSVSKAVNKIPTDGKD